MLMWHVVMTLYTHGATWRCHTTPSQRLHGAEKGSISSLMMMMMIIIIIDLDGNEIERESFLNIFIVGLKFCVMQDMWLHMNCWM